MAWRFALALGALVCATSAAAKGPPQALVENIKNAPAARVEPLDYVYAGDMLDLRPRGALQLAYFASCVVDTIKGGVVRITNRGARVSHGGKTIRKARPCGTSALSVAADGREAGVAVKRGAPLPGQGGTNVVVQVARPVFTWPAGQPDKAQVAVYALQAIPKTLVWTGEAAGVSLAYPDDAPSLTSDLAYEVTVERAQANPLSTIFYVDLDAVKAGGPPSSVVPLGF